MAGPEGEEKGVAGEKGTNKPENLADLENRKAPNANFGKRQWFEAISMEEFLKRDNQASGPHCQENSLGNPRFLPRGPDRLHVF
ncbi:MAG: hypothetical protein NTW21_07495 [Verrucomicrobia bacterium]|nr:hypothetical protein [Verrucomicrobiota bacterium]